MADEELLSILAAQPLFRRLDPEELARVAARVKGRTLAPGEELFIEGKTFPAYFILRSGRLALLRIDADGVERLIRHLQPGEGIGVHALFLNDPRDVTAMAITRVEGWLLEKSEFDALLAEHPDLIHRLELPPDVEARLRAPRFPWLEPEEQVLAAIHRHWFSVIPVLLPPLVLLLVFIVLTTFLAAELGWWPALFLNAIPLILLGAQVWNWWDDQYILTTRRIVHIERERWLYVFPGPETRQDMPLDQIQEVQILRRTPLASPYLFDFGDIEVEAFSGRVAFSNLPQPDGIRRLIYEQIDRLRALQQARQRYRLQQELRHRLGLAPTPPEAAPALSTPAPPGWVERIGLILRAVAHYLFPPLRETAGDRVIYRKHWVALFRSIGLGPPMALGLWVLGWVLHAHHVWPIDRIEPGIRWGGLILSGMLLGIWWWWRYENWRNDEYILTPTQLILSQRLPMLMREETQTANLARIQSVEYTIPSILARLLNYGHVVVRVPGGDFYLQYVGSPRQVQQEITRRMEAYRRRLQEEEAARQRRNVVDTIAAYDRLRFGPPGVGGGHGALPGAQGGPHFRS
ncbi:cyclic nucleotide-binding domain-containing protein [Thermoflexus sp.]|uniref:cyclic nucleotide-binding domain-containing protein n=1 Tax=Thermoflexus sp. TaxID=1969742 RepID=UPI002ADD94AF|nr:cyclic nucleotide-binding domain-containing protein [Thermoflexus sp.]